jgi:hypothetical protein
MKNAYSYVRWSTLSQGETGRASQTRQTKTAKEWIRDYGKGEYVLSDEMFLDAGKSAFKGKNIAKDEYGKAKGELAKFIELVEENKISRDSILLVDSYDRFSRLPASKSLTLFMDVINSGIGLVFTGSFEKRIINSTMIDREPYILQFIVGELIRSTSQSEETSRKVKLAKQFLFANIKKGIVQRNNLPKYFTFIPNEPINPRCNIGKYVHNELTPIVKDIVDMLLNGKSLYAIADHYNEKKIKTFKGYEWSGNGISHILRNRLLFGEYKGVKNFVPPIIDLDTFDKIQNVLNQNQFTKGQRGKINIFRGICFCADCGHTMSVMASSHKGSSYRYLRCSHGAIGKHNECKNRLAFRLNDMEAEFFVNFLFKNPKQVITETDNRELKELNKTIATKQSRLNQINSEIDKLIGLLETLPMPELKTKLAKLNTERDTIKTELDSLNSKVSNIQDSPQMFDKLKKLLGKDSDYKPKFKADKDGVPIFERDELDTAIESVIESLKDEFTREGIRIMLPSLIGKITVDTNEGQFYVFNRMGKQIYESFHYESNRNCTTEWRRSLLKHKKAS